MEWSFDGSGRYKPNLQETDGTVSVASMTRDGDEVQLPNVSIEKEGKTGRAIVTIDGSRRVAHICLLYTSPSPRDATLSRMPSSA